MAMRELRGIHPTDRLPETAEVGGIPRKFVRLGTDGVTRITTEGLAVNFARQMIADVPLDQWVDYCGRFFVFLFDTLMEHGASIQNASEECAIFRAQIKVELERHCNSLSSGLLVTAPAGSA